MMGSDGSGMMGSGIYWWLLAGSAILVVIGVILLVAWLFGRTRTSQDTPLAILQRRYAQGEIGPDEYARIRSDLLPNASGPAWNKDNQENTA